MRNEGPQENQSGYCLHDISQPIPGLVLGKTNPAPASMLEHLPSAIVNFYNPQSILTPAVETMKTLASWLGRLVLACAVVGLSSGTQAQEDSQRRAPLFATPSLQLRPQPRPAEPTTNSVLHTVQNPVVESDDLSVQLLAERRLQDFEQAIFRRLDREGYFTRRFDTDTPWERGIQTIFEPETFRVGKTSVSCSLATAIKRKNPLCLLSPLFLNVSW
jgi:hypothetical protein